MLRDKYILNFIKWGFKNKIHCIKVEKLNFSMGFRVKIV